MVPFEYLQASKLDYQEVVDTRFAAAGPNSSRKDMHCWPCRYPG